MGEVAVSDAADRVVAVVRDAGRDEFTVRRYQVVLDRFAAFLTGRGVDTASELLCIDFIANQTGVRLAALHGPVKDRDVQAVRRPVLLMTEALAGRAIDVDRLELGDLDWRANRSRSSNTNQAAVAAAAAGGRRLGNHRLPGVSSGRAST